MKSQTVNERITLFTILYKAFNPRVAFGLFNEFETQLIYQSRVGYFF